MPLVEKGEDASPDDGILDVGLLAVRTDEGEPTLVIYADEETLAERVPGVPFAVADLRGLLRFALSRGIAGARLIRRDTPDLLLDQDQLRAIAEASAGKLSLITADEPPDGVVAAIREVLSDRAVKAYLFERPEEGRRHFVLGLEAAPETQAELEGLREELRARLARETTEAKLSLLPMSPAQIAELDEAGVPRLA